MNDFIAWREDRTRTVLETSRGRSRNTRWREILTEGFLARQETLQSDDLTNHGSRALADLWSPAEFWQGIQLSRRTTSLVLRKDCDKRERSDKRTEIAT